MALLKARVLLPRVNHPPQFVLYVVSSIYPVSDTKPRSTHRATAQRLVAPRPSGAPYTGLSHIGALIIYTLRDLSAR
eukprot:6212153-Pleurochrysis_carterae.AAC.4